MNIVISHVYSSDNKGDAALLSVLMSDIRRQYGPRVTINILTLDEIREKNKRKFEGHVQHYSFMYYALNSHHNKFLKLIDSLGIMFITNTWARAYRWFGVKLPLPRKLKAVAEMYLKADLIIPVGGGYLRTGPSLVTMVNLLLMLHPLKFAWLIRKPTVLYTQSVGPFSRKIETGFMRRTLRKMNLVIIREEKSVKLLKSIGVSDNVVRSVDSGFLFQGKKSVGLRKKLGVKKDALLVGVTVRKWLDKAAQDRYETAIARTIDAAITKHDATVVFIPQVTATFHKDDDRVASQDVYARLQNQDRAYVVTEDLDHFDIKSMYDELDLIIGTRFHSVIFSLTSYVPAIAIEYEHKTSGIMDDLDISQWSVKIEDVTGQKLTKKFDALVKEREAYKTHLKKALKPYIASAENAIVLADEAYRQSLDR